MGGRNPAIVTVSMDLLVYSCFPSNEQVCAVNIASIFVADVCLRCYGKSATLYTVVT